jgi:hypothetical protein
MEKANFKNLLTDLYSIYNPANIQYVDDLVDRYSRLEFDALRNIFIKYNRKNTPYYNEEMNTDKYIIDLIKTYESGERPLEGKNLNDYSQEKPEVLAQKTVLEGFQELKAVQEEVKEVIVKKTQDIDDLYKEKENKFKITLENIYSEFEKKASQINVNNDDDVVIRIFSNYSNSELDLPNKKIIAGLGKGSRLIIHDKDNKPIGLEIIDITYDGVSDINGKPLVEIFLEKV